MIGSNAWIDAVPTLVSSLVTLVVAFGVWWLTVTRERKRWAFESKNEAYIALYASMLAFANESRPAFLRPDDAEAVRAYNDVDHTVALDFARALVVGSGRFLTTHQVPIGEAIAMMEKTVASRLTANTPWTLDIAATEPLGEDFLATRRALHHARTELLQLATAEANAFLKNKR